MLLFQDFAAYAKGPFTGSSAVTIGNFDGCHLGHQALLRTVAAEALALGGPAIAVTFSPRPDVFLQGKTPEPLLFTTAQKTRAFTEAGIDVEILKAFDEPFSRLTPDDFYAACLRKDLRANVVVVGDNFRFGHGRAGDAAYLAKVGSADGTRVILGSAVEHQGERISSTRIRGALARGDAAGVAAMLGRPYLLEGEIQRGDQLGRQLGVPTANLEGVTQLIPAYGIYAGYVWLSRLRDDAPTVMRKDSMALPAVFSIGVRPTLGVKAPPLRIEAHILRGVYGADSLYGLRAGFYLSHRLRDEMKFSGMDELKAQMAADIAQAKALVDKT